MATDCRRIAWAVVCAGVSLAISARAMPDDDPGARFQTSAWSEQALLLPAGAGSPFRVEIELDGLPHEFWLEPWTFRAPDAEAVVVAGGVPSLALLPEARTYRGVSLTDPTVEAAGALGPDGLTLAIIDGDDTAAREQHWAVQPLHVGGMALGEGLPVPHVVLRASDALARGACGGSLEAGVSRSGGGDPEALAQFEIELAVEADFPYFERTGASLDSTILDIETVLAGVILAYERDIDSTIRTTTYVVRTDSASDPYTTIDPFQILPQFRAHWNASQTGIHRDVAHLFTGRQLIGSVVGVAYLPGLCTTDGYAVSEALFSANLSSRIALVAHELGHNAGASHCSGNNCHIMCPTIGGCGGLGDSPKFGPGEINQIRKFMAGAACIGAPCPADLDGDGIADLNDFFLFLQWASDRDPRGDLDGDGRVSASDFFLFLDGLQSGC